MPAFSREEYFGRLARVKARMAASGIEVLLCSDPSNMNYLSGYDGWSFYVHQLVAVALDLDEPVWIGRAMDAPGARLTTYLRAENIEAYPETLVDSTDGHPMEFVAGVLQRRGWGGAVVGVEMDCWQFSAMSYQILTANLPGARIENGFGLVNWVRLVKSEPEISCMRAAAVIVAAAMREGVAAIEPGLRECDLAGRIAAVQFAGTKSHVGDYPAALASIPGGARTAAPHLTWSGDRYERDSIAYLELAGCHKRYHAALARTVYLGAPPAQVTELASAVSDGMAAALDAARAGATCEAVEAAWRGVISKAGYSKQSRIGYSIGLGYPPDWGERTASLREGDLTELGANMCFHVILGMWQNEWGYEVSETIRILDHGPPEILTSFPRELVVKT